MRSIKVFFTPIYIPKWHFGGLGIGLKKSSLEQIGRANPHPLHFSVKSFQLLPSIIVSVVPQNVNQFGLLRFLHCTPTLSEEYQNFLKNYKKYEVWARFSQFLFLTNRLS